VWEKEVSLKLKQNNKGLENKIHKKSIKLLIIGISLVILGFIVLSMVNRMATNWAGYVSPLLLVTGWALIAIGLWKGEK
jgi:hypothetical protein